MPRWSALVAAITLPVLLAGDAPERGRELLRLVPKLDHAVAHHLVRDDTDAFLEYCREIGPVQTMSAIGWLQGGVRYDSREVHDRSWHALYPYIDRVAHALDSVYARPEFARMHAYHQSLGDSAYACAQWLGELLRVQADTADLVSKLPRYEQLTNELIRLGDERAIMGFEGNLALEVQRYNLIDVRMRLLRSALSRARRLRESQMECQLLGELGAGYIGLGYADTGLACYHEGIALADRHAIPEQAARVRIFLADYYFNRGRLAAGARLLAEAQVASRRLGGSPLEIRAVLNTMLRYSQLRCWDVVSRCAERLPVLIRALERHNYPREAWIYSIRSRLWNARLRAARGRVAEAADSLDAIYEATPSTAPGIVLEPLHLARVEALYAAGRHSDCVTAADLGIAFADSLHFSHIHRDLARMRARAEFALGQYDRALHSLEEASHMSDTEQGVPRPSTYLIDGLAANIALDRNRPNEARRLFERGLSRLRDSLATFDRGPQTDLAIHEAGDLQRVARSLFAPTTGLELAFELYWRSLASWSGVESRRASWAGPHRERIDSAAGARAIHLVFAETPEGIVRWTSSPLGVQRDRLGLAPKDLALSIDRVVAMASADPADLDAPMPDELRRLAASLGETLLPAEVRSSAERIVKITAEGTLGRLPFELLSVGSGDTYVPLLARHHVTYARPVRARARRTVGGPNVILADSPRPGSGSAGRQGLDPLPAVESELAAANARLPDLRVIRGNELSKSDLLAAWRRAGVIYVAAHLVRDPDAPIFNYFPIAFGEQSRRLEDDYLDIRDVRDTDLTGCQLVVLSSCASGEPYVVGAHSGPSMADSFIDAGASAVIHTRWRVRDESAAETAPLLAQAWLDSRSPSAGAWREARLELMQGARGIRHPFQWAAWSVSTPHSVRAWTPPPAEFIAERASASTAARVRPAASSASAESPREEESPLHPPIPIP